MMSTSFIKQTKNHTLAIRQCIVLIENIKILIEYSCTDIKEIFSQLNKTNNYYLLNFVSEISNGIENDSFDLNNYFDYNDNVNYLDNDDVEYISGFLSMLGKSDVSGQISNCELYKSFFTNKLSILEKSEKSKCKSTSTLFIGVGLALSILII